MAGFVVEAMGREEAALKHAAIGMPVRLESDFASYFTLGSLMFTGMDEELHSDGRTKAAHESFHNGILSCFFHGSLTCLFCSIRKARATRARVSCGWITSSR